MAEILLYCWQYHTQLWISELGVRYIVLQLVNNPIVECRTTISKVITDEATTSRICKHMCRDLECEKTLDSTLFQYLILLNVLLRESPVFFRDQVGKVDFFRAVAAGCQRQLCSGDECCEDNLPILEEGFKVVE